MKATPTCISTVIFSGNRYCPNWQRDSPVTGRRWRGPQSISPVAAALLEQLAVDDARQAVNDKRLDINVLRTFSSERAANLVRWWIRKETDLILSTSRLQNIIRQLCDAKANARVECVIGLAVLRRYRDTAYLDFGKAIAPYAIQWRGEGCARVAGRQPYRIP